MMTGSQIRKMICPDCSEGTFEGQSLRTAAKSGHDNCVVILIETGCDVNNADDFGQTALMYAACLQSEKCLDILLEAGTHIDQKDVKGNTALMFASSNGSVECVRYLIEHNASIDATDRLSRTALMKSATDGNLSVLQLLIRAGADIELKDVNGETALTLASSYGHLECVKCLIEHNARVDVTNESIQTLLMNSAIGGNPSRLQMLIKAGVTPDLKDPSGNTPLILASYYGRRESVKCLTGLKANVDMVDNSGQTALMMSASRGNLTCLQNLIEAGANVNIQDALGMTALMFAVIRSDIDCLRTLIENKACVNLTNKEGKSALALMMQDHETRCGSMGNLLPYGTRGTNSFNCLWETSNNGEWENEMACLRCLIEANVNVDLQDNDGKTALMEAVDKPCLVMLVEHMVNVGADVNLRDKFGKTALMYAAKKTSTLFAMKLLIYNGAEVDAQDNDGVTAFMIASRNLGAPQIKLFIESKANLDLRDNRGNTVLSYAFKTNGHCNPFGMSRFYYLLPFVEPVFEGDIRSLLEDFCSEVKNESYDEDLNMEFLRLKICNGIVKDRSANESVSLLKQSLINMSNLDTARYLFATCYIQEIDMKEIRQIHLVPQISDTAMTLLSNALCNPWPLGKLALIAMSSALGSSPGREKYVKEIGLPVRLQEMLMFQIPLARLSVHHWKDIPLCFDQVEYSQPLLYAWPFGRILQVGHCQCDKCKGKGYNFI